MNRLKLDFSLQYRDERNDFLNQYLLSPQFLQRPPTEEECETMANYLLWGKDRKTGLNAKQDGSVELSSKHGDWDSDNQCESLDALIEMPTFNEASLSDLNAASTKIKREVFSRDEALAKSPDNLKPIFVELFAQIDKLDLKINYYELLHGRRVKPPRDQLLRKFDDETKARLQEQVTHWNQFQYLKQRHELVELRRQQYTLRDNYAPVIVNFGNSNTIVPTTEADWDVGIEVLPLGIWNKNEASRLLFQSFDDLIPQNFNENQLRQIYKVYWQKKAYIPGVSQRYFDFRELEHVYNIFQLFYELDVTKEEEQVLYDQNTSGLMRALRYYMNMADLTEVQREILDMKLLKKKNSDIAYDVNHKWKKSYTANYISTIFRQRIIPKINEAAAYHVKLVENLCYPEEFKVCSCCGKMLLRDATNFTRKTRSKDGFTARCKKCEKLARSSKGD